MDQARKIGIIIITYNNARLLPPQVECIRKFCKDNFEIVIIDNSTDLEQSEAIEYHCTQFDLELIRTCASAKNSSDSHSFAANASYLLLKDRYKYFFYLDHDCFPVKDFSVIKMLDGEYFAGIKQAKSKTYLWPGCFMFDASVDGIDFGVSHVHGLDTGGNLYKALEAYPDKTVFFSETYKQNPGFNKGMYNFYAMIQDTFMHFINSSNWNHQDTNEERVNSLLNILKNKTDG